MTIEQKALKLWGETDDPQDSIWILPDGTMLNGCQGGYIRDVDHAEIGQFFAPSKSQDPGSNWIYIKKFIRRGNIRMSMDGHACYFMLSKIPTRTQWRSMGYCMAKARRLGKIVEIERIASHGRPAKLYGRMEYIMYLSRYAPNLV